MLPWFFHAKLNIFRAVYKTSTKFHFNVIYGIKINLDNMLNSKTFRSFFTKNNRT